MVKADHYNRQFFKSLAQSSSQKLIEAPCRVGPSEVSIGRRMREIIMRWAISPRPATILTLVPRDHAMEISCGFAFRQGIPPRGIKYRSPQPRKEQ